MGPLMESRRGNRYILVLVDYFTKWAVARPIKKADAPTVAHEIMDSWIAHFGVPMQLHSDQGSQFQSQLVREMCALLNIDKTNTTTFRPQGNG